jgi:hypothetical protein
MLTLVRPIVAKGVGVRGGDHAHSSCFCAGDNIYLHREERRSHEGRGEGRWRMLEEGYIAVTHMGRGEGGVVQPGGKD